MPGGRKADDLFARQHGALSRAQALDLGMTVRQIDYRVETKRWTRVEWGVYASSSMANTPKRKLSVACLAGGEGTVASPLSAAALVGLAKEPSEPHVTVPRNASGRMREAIVHHRDLPLQDVCVADRIPSTTPARTLVDCAEILSYKRLCRLVDTAFYKKVTTPKRVYEAAARAGKGPGKGGWTKLKQAMKVWQDDVSPGNPGEARALRWLERNRFPPPIRQYQVFDEHGAFVARVDFAWPDDMALMEYDGEEFHGPRQALTHAQREILVQRLGFTVIRADKRDFQPSATRLLNVLPGILQKRRRNAA